MTSGSWTVTWRNACTGADSAWVRSVGLISAVGENVSGFAVGGRVGIDGDGLDAPGIVSDGGFGEKCIGKVEQLVPISHNVSFIQAASGTDSGKTSDHAVVVAGGVANGTRVGIIGLGGLGGLGLTGATIAVGLGATVYGADIDESVHSLATDAGVKEMVTGAAQLAAFSLDAIVDSAGAGVATAAAVESINPGGRIVLVGMARDEMTLSGQSVQLSAPSEVRRLLPPPCTNSWPAVTLRLWPRQFRSTGSEKESTSSAAAKFVGAWLLVTSELDDPLTR